MINLRKFYFENCRSDDEYYYRWYFDIMDKYYIYLDGEKSNKPDFLVLDIEHAIQQYKAMSYPNISNFNGMDYILMSFYLREMGYIIKEFPNQLRMPNLDFNKEIRAYAQTNNYAKRREITNNLSFEKNADIFIEEELDELFRKISTRDNSFNEMKLDEKLQDICNCLMRLIKKYGFPTYTTKVEEFISPKKIKKLKGELQCFRHADESKVEDYLEKRKEFSNEDKETLVEVGILYVRQYKDFMK